MFSGEPANTNFIIVVLNLTEVRTHDLRYQLHNRCG